MNTTLDPSLVVDITFLSNYRISLFGPANKQFNIIHAHHSIIAEQNYLLTINLID